VAETRGYRPDFSDAAVEFFSGLTRRRQRKLLDRARELAADPFLAPDYQSTDADGRKVGHLLVDNFVFSYWVDDAARRVMIVEIDDAE
jgi:mRNA-degrading endonuclease RelE of RelBE toxin-antitoxin system